MSRKKMKCPCQASTLNKGRQESGVSSTQTDTVTSQPPGSPAGLVAADRKSTPSCMKRAARRAWRPHAWRPRSPAALARGLAVRAPAAPCRAPAVALSACLESELDINCGSLLCCRKRQCDHPPAAGLHISTLDVVAGQPARAWRSSNYSPAKSKRC